MVTYSRKLEFAGHSGASLAARLDMPEGQPRAFALFAHCFTCSKDLLAARCIAVELARAGIAVLRFDFTGLGSSEGEFASTNFSSNVADLESAADHLRRHYEPPALLIGHSLGGAAVLAAAGRIPETRAVVTIGAPSDVGHVLGTLGSSLDRVESEGAAEVEIAGRRFRVERQFVEDARSANLARLIAELRRPLLVLHAPRDEIVGIDHASAIFQAARHPKSFISLDTADHLLSDPDDAAFAAAVIAAWTSRYLPADRPQDEEETEHVTVSETGEGKFQNAVRAGRHRLFADEPRSFGGLDSGPSPYDFLSIALGACTSMTLRLYAERKGITLGRISVDVAHEKIHARDCDECTEEERADGGRIDRFERTISVAGGVPEALRDKLVEIAGKCPVHRTLESQARVRTVIRQEGSGD
jgi:putative redox protein